MLPSRRRETRATGSARSPTPKRGALVGGTTAWFIDQKAAIFLPRLPLRWLILGAGAPPATLFLDMTGWVVLTVDGAGLRTF